MDMNREQLLKEIMAADFTCIELNLFLNTHPCDQRAISMFNNSVQRALMLRANYEKMYGPLTPFAYSKSPWQWIESPWPWEAEYNPDYK